MSSWGYREYVPASVKKARAARSIEKLKKKNPQLAPIQIAGRKLARTWWGIAWNENLERYADYANRIERGRSYVRQGAVLDLKIEPGKVMALVQGSRVNPYTVEVAIQPLKPSAWAAIVRACTGNIHSLQDLISGKFPKSLADLFTARGDGLFPTPREISLNCSCPDWADMCKHVAAVLYGIGARFDDDPTLFFRLRQVNIDELVTDALNQTSDSLLDRSARKSRRSLDHSDLSGLFGVDIAVANASGLPTAEGTAAGVSTVAVQPPAEAKKRGRPRKAAAPVPVPEPAPAAEAKKRGRPRKAAAPVPVPEPAPAAETKKPGRPRKAAAPVPVPVPAPAAEVKKRGRPRKAAAPDAVPEPAPAAEVKKRGRPRKAAAPDAQPN